MGLFGLFSRKKSLIESGLLNGMSDYHSHILFGVDDGIKTLDDSLAVLDYLHIHGVREIWCTPHIMEEVPNTTEFLKRRFEELFNAYDGDLKIHLAAEYMLDNLFQERLLADDLLLLYDDLLLVETSSITPPFNMTGTLQDILKAGYRPMLAHPERYRYMNENDYDRLHQMGVYFQLNISSMVGFYGETARNKAKMLLEKGYYHLAGSDCHRYAALVKQHSVKELTSSDMKLLGRLIYE